MSAKPENERDRIIRIIEDMVSAPILRDPVLRAAHCHDIESAAAAIIAQRESGEPVAWTFEYLCDNGVDEPTWEPGASVLNPSKWTAFQHRNIQPAFAAPQALAEPIGDALRSRLHDYAMFASTLGPRRALADVYDNNGAEMAKDVMAAIAPRPAEAQARIEALEAGLAGFDDEYMTSEKHHPGHVLIPVEVFERVRALLTGSTPKPDEALAICREVAALESEDGGRSFPSKDLCARARALTAALSGTLK